MMATYSRAQTTPKAAAVIRAGTEDPLAWTMNPVAEHELAEVGAKAGKPLDDRPQ